MKEFVVTKKQAKRMQEAEWEKDTKFEWCKADGWQIVQDTCASDESYPAPTVTEIFENLPNGVAEGVRVMKKTESHYTATLIDFEAAYKGDDEYEWVKQVEDTLLEAVAELWLCIYESDYIK